MKNIEEYRNIPVYFWNKITPYDKAFFYEHLSNLIDWWVSLINALEWFLEKTTNPKLAREIANLLIFVDSWDNFSIAMKKLPEVFDAKEVAIVEAGESSWTMQKSFENLAIQLRDQEELKQKVKGALTYPIIIMVFLCVAVIVIMTYVIPKLTPLFVTAWIELPFATRTLIATSNFFINNFIILFVIVIALFFGIKSFAKTENGRNFFDSLLLKLPLISPIYKNYIIAQVSSNLWLLISSWIPILKTLSLAWLASNNLAYNKIITWVAKQVSMWKKLTQGFEEMDEDHYYFTNDFIQMISAWEKTSTVNKVCYKIHKQYTREVENSLSILIKWIEPSAILISWLFVTWFALAIFSAVLKITETV